MKKILLLFCIAVTVASCKPGVPSKYIQPSELEDILYDYHIADGMAQLPGADSLSLMSYRQAVFKKYDITKADFDSSMVYYMRHADLLHSVYQKLSDRMGIEAAGLGTASTNIALSTASGDTANVWNGDKSLALSTFKPANLHSFVLEADTAFHAGDRIMLNFDTQFIFQDGMRDGVAVLAVEFKNDSIATQNVRMSSSSHFSMTIEDERRLGIKRVRGFFLLNGNVGAGQNLSTLKLMFIDNIQLVRMHQAKKKPEEGRPGSKDSIPMKVDRPEATLSSKEIKLVL